MFKAPITASWKSIQKEVDKLRSLNRGKTFTNCFSSPAENKELKLITTDGAIIFSQNEEEFSRLYYYAADLDSLAILLKTYNSACPLLLNYVDRQENKSICTAFIKGGFTLKAHYVRMIHEKFPKPLDADIPEFAVSEEQVELTNILRKIFDPMTDYLPNSNELLELINSKQVLVRRTKGRLTSAVIFRVKGRQANLNYIFNQGPSGEGLRIKESFYRCMAERGLTTGFLWVNTNNDRAKKMYALSGWESDGLNDWFYLKKNDK